MFVLARRKIIIDLGGRRVCKTNLSTLQVAGRTCYGAAVFGLHHPLWDCKVPPAVAEIQASGHVQCGWVQSLVGSKKALYELLEL